MMFFLFFILMAGSFVVMAQHAEEGPDGVPPMFWAGMAGAIIFGGLLVLVEVFRLFGD